MTEAGTEAGTEVGEVRVHVAPAGTPPPDGDPAAAGWVDIGWTTDGGSMSSYIVDPEFTPYIAFEPGGLVDPATIHTSARPGLATFLNLDLWQQCVSAAAAGTGGDSSSRSYHNPATSGPAAIDIMPLGVAAERAAAALREWVTWMYGQEVDVDDEPPQSYATRATSPRPAAADDVDDLTATIEGLCACPCRQPLDPDGASAYFATAACQRRWHGAQATDPGDVYRREDAAHTSLHDQADPQLTPSDRRPPRSAAEQDQERERDRRRAQRREQENRLADLAHEARIRGRRRSGALSLRRRCERCNDATWPASRSGAVVTGVRPGPRLGDGSRVVHVDTRPDTWQECAVCTHRFPGPRMLAQVDVADNGDFIFRLTDDTVWVSVTLDRARLDDSFAGQPLQQRAFIDGVWMDLEAKLLRRIDSLGPAADTGAGAYDPWSGQPPAAGLDGFLQQRQRMFEYRLAMMSPVVTPQRLFGPVTSV